MKILCIGDIVGDGGVDIVCRRLPALKASLKADICIANGENAEHHGTGLTQEVAQALMSHSVDVITTGNHALRRAKVDLYTENETVLMPANFPDTDLSASSCELDFGAYSVLVLNVAGTAFMEPLDNPFECARRILAKSKAKYKIIDFHAQATAEKKAFAYYLDGQASVIFGTHTHVATADEQVLPKGTGYISDLGMCGPSYSVLGVNVNTAIDKQRLHRSVPFATADGKCEIWGALFTLDEDGKCTKAERVRVSE